MARIEHLVRFRDPAGVRWGRLAGQRVRVLSGAPFLRPRETGEEVQLRDVTLLHPCVPSKILCVALNYASHLEGRPRPERPEIFVVPRSACLDPGGTIVIPPGTEACEFEGELVLVIGRETRNVTEAEAAEAIFGVTCGNDVSARDWQRGDLQWWRAKGCDTFAPFGPFITCGVDFGDLLLTTRVNGDVRQQQRTSDLIFSPAQLVHFIAQHMTLQPGDLIYTGTPGHTAPLRPGDRVEVEIEDVGLLRNTVA